PVPAARAAPPAPPPEAPPARTAWTQAAYRRPAPAPAAAAPPPPPAPNGAVARSTAPVPPAPAGPRTTDRMATAGTNGGFPRAGTSSVLVPPPPPPPRHTPPPAPAPVRPATRGAPEESGPVTEELNEASFFLDQGLLDEAREVLETVELVRPGLPRTAALRERLAALETSKAAAPSLTPPPARSLTPPPARSLTPPPAPRAEPPGVEAIPVGTGSYNLAEELADELEELGPPPEEPAAAGADFQYSVEEVFSEFKKGLERVVQSTDVDTHYDLGIAYKEMGLLDDAVQVFEVARQASQGQPKEVDCLTMIGLLQGMRNDPQRAVAAFRDALASPHAAPREVSLRYELGQAHEAASAPGKALGQYLAVQEADPAHRDVAERVRRLSATARPEEDGPPRPTTTSSPTGRPAPTRPSAPEPSPTAKTRKVGYL
ncbi:MAG TPA: tetratricopeptide repeat protein, partial [Myxococcaceae bacterium]|nr:tetratricopeptide repeat protein [Myxococcaceae bacterium]